VHVQSARAVSRADHGLIRSIGVLHSLVIG
jgi:hypothetical protein